MTRRYKQIVQFGDISFNGGKPSYSFSQETKTKVFEYANNHGAFAVFPDDGQKFSTYDIDVSGYFDIDRIETTELSSYIKWVKSSLIKAPQKLWAINEAGEAIYCNAFIKTMSESSSDDTSEDLAFQFTFTNIDGVWTKASKDKTFLQFADCLCKPWVNLFCPDGCSQMNKKIGCCVHSCSSCTLSSEVETSRLCDIAASELLKDFGCNPPSFTISCPVYDPFNPDLGYTIGGCNFDNEDSIGFNFCADTDIPTRKGKILLYGQWTNPKVSVNNSVVELAGTYSGMLDIETANNQIFYTDLSGVKTEVTKNITLATTIPFASVLPGDNTIFCQGAINTSSCVFLDFDMLTY
jgi:hypothetical protein